MKCGGLRVGGVWGGWGGGGKEDCVNNLVRVGLGGGGLGGGGVGGLGGLLEWVQ